MDIIYSYKFGYGYIFELKMNEIFYWILIIFDKISYMRNSSNQQHILRTFNVKETNVLNKCEILGFDYMKGNKRWFTNKSYLDMDKEILLFGENIFNLTKCSNTDNTFILKHIHFNNHNNIVWIYI